MRLAGCRGSVGTRPRILRLWNVKVAFVSSVQNKIEPHGPICEGKNMAERRHIIGGPDGWLRIRTEPTGQIVAVPELLQVEFVAHQGGRDFGIVLEGVHAGKKFSVRGGSLDRGGARRGPAQLVFDPDKNRLTYAGGTVSTVSSQAGPTPTGVHPIQIPDFPHDGGLGYLSHSRYAKTWFFLGHGNSRAGNDRYLHCGRVSAGCITVGPSEWSKLYEYLIRCRSNDGKTVGSVTVVR